MQGYGNTAVAVQHHCSKIIKYNKVAILTQAKLPLKLTRSLALGAERAC